MFTELPTHLRAAPICKNSFQINKENTPSWWHWNCFQTFYFVSVSSEEFVELIFAFKSVYMPSLLTSINAVISRLFRRFSKGNTTFSFDVWTTFFVLSLCNASEKIPGGFRIYFLDLGYIGFTPLPLMTLPRQLILSIIKTWRKR